MACSVSPKIISSNTVPHGTFENRNSDFVQPEGDLIKISLDFEGALPLIKNPNHKDLQSRLITVLSNTVHNVAVIETTRFLAIVGLICSAFASVLLPALGFAALAASACVLKNRAIQLDKKNLENSDRTIQEVTDQTLSRSASMKSQTSKSNSDEPMNFTSSLCEEAFHEVNVVPNIEETFLNSWGKIDDLNPSELYGLLTICYSYLHGKTANMPLHLNRKGIFANLSLKETKAYLAEKYKKMLDKSNLKSSVKQNGAEQILDINEKQMSLEKANPSLIMKIVQKLYQQASREQNKFGHKTEAKCCEDNAKHAEEYIAQLEAHEILHALHFAENVSETST
ncbi:MAG: hypothetical protein LBC45_05205 [Chlamydiales bacterium]|jgi:hypothetical protein|nr:hypothetical protein [Chlamydiales bacterium]